MGTHIAGTSGHYVVQEDTAANFTLSVSNEISVIDGRIQRIRNSRPYGATDGNTQLYLPLDEGAASANPLDISGLAWAGGIATNDGASNWRAIDGAPAFVPENGRRYLLNNFIPAPASSIDFTLECMVWSNSGRPTVRETLLGYNHAVNKVYIWRETNGRVVGYCVGPGGTAVAQISTTDPLGDGQWHHLRLVIKEKDVKLYIDGVVGATVSTVDHRFTGTNAAAFEVGYSGAAANYCHSLALASVRVSNVERTGTAVVELFDTTEETAYPTATFAVADMENFGTVEKVYVDQRLSSGYTGSVQLYRNVDGAGWVAVGGATTGSDRYWTSGLSFAPTSTFALGVGIASTGGQLYMPPPHVHGFGFVYTESVPGAPVLGAPTASTTSSVTLPITAAAGITDTVLHAIAPDNTQVSVTLTTATIPAGTTTSYQMTGLTADVLYRFIAHHRNVNGFAGSDSNVVTARAAATFASENAELFALSTPVFASSASLGTGSGLGFRWSAIANASSYQVIVYNEGTTARVASGTTTGLTKTFGGLTEGFYEATVQARAIDPEVKSEPSDPALVWLDDDGDTRTMTILKAVQARIQDNVTAFGDRVYLRSIGSINAQLFKRAQGQAVCVVTAAGESAEDGDHVEYLTTVRIIVGTTHNVVGDEQEDTLLGVGDRTADAELGVWALTDRVAALFHQHTLGQVVEGSFEVGKGADLQADDTKMIIRSIDIRILNLLATL